MQTDPTVCEQDVVDLMCPSKVEFKGITSNMTFEEFLKGELNSLLHIEESGKRILSYLFASLLISHIPILQ